MSPGDLVVWGDEFTDSKSRAFGVVFESHPATIHADPYVRVFWHDGLYQVIQLDKGMKSHWVNRVET